MVRENKKISNDSLDKEIEAKLAKMDAQEVPKKTSSKKVGVATGKKSKKEEIEKIKETIQKRSQQPAKIKKPFFQDLGDIFADNFVFAFGSLRSAILSLQFGGKELFAQKIFVLLFVAIPALFGGFVVFATGLILILFWILFLALKRVSDSLQNVEDGIKNKLKSWREMIKCDRDASLTARAIQYSVYSLATGICGAMSIVIKGVKIPVKGMGDIVKVVGNLTDKVGERFNMLTKMPAKIHMEMFKRQMPEAGRSQSIKVQRQMEKNEQRIQKELSYKREKFINRTRAKEQDVKKSKEAEKEFKSRTRLKEEAKTKAVEKAKEAEKAKEIKQMRDIKEAEQAKETGKAKEVEQAKEVEKVSTKSQEAPREEPAKSAEPAQNQTQFKSGDLKTEVDLEPERLKEMGRMQEAEKLKEMERLKEQERAYERRQGAEKSGAKEKGAEFDPLGGIFEDAMKTFKGTMKPGLNLNIDPIGLATKIVEKTIKDGTEIVEDIIETGVNKKSLNKWSSRVLNRWKHTSKNLLNRIGL